MPAAISVRDDYTANDLRRLAARAKDASQSRRLLALAAVRDGMSRGEAARIGGMDRQTLRDWVHRFNADGPEGLVNRPLPGRACWLTPDQLRELAEIVETGPDPETDGIVRWRRIDLKRVIEGDRNLRLDTARRYAAALKLGDKQVEYFCTLVEFNQARTSSGCRARLDAVEALNFEQPIRVLPQHVADVSRPARHPAAPLDRARPSDELR